MLQELQYPFDAQAILAKKKQLKRRLLENTEGMVEKKIAILGGSTTNNIKLVLELFLLNQGIKPTFYESEYNQYYQDAMFPNMVLEDFAPDVIYIHTTSRNIITKPQIQDSADRIDEMLQAEKEKYYGMWDRLEQVYHCPIIQNNFEMPFYRLLGNKDASDIHGFTNYLMRLNSMMYEYAQKRNNFYICDVNYISADYGLQKWSDPFYFHMYKYAVAVPAIPYLSFEVAKIIKSIFGKNKKGFVLDLDNTLWGGTIGDDGVENIILGPEESEGQVYSEFQEYIKSHKQLGVVLNVNSKNDMANALEGLNHPDSALHPDDFIVIKANWNPKDRNFKQIAEELNLLPESLVFVDDNPAERHIVEQQLQGVCAPDIGEVYNYIIRVDRNGYFEPTVISEDDAKRNEMYKENIQRTRLQASFSDYGDYLRSLQMHATIQNFIPVYFSRIAQLSNKSNQFNLTTRRYTQEEIEEIAEDNQYITLYGKLEDKFGDNGVVSVVIGKKDGTDCHLELWLMSCRVLKRDMEFAMMDVFVKQCRKESITRIIGHFYPTAKNGMVKDFYGAQGFTKIEEDESGNTAWECIVDEYKQQNCYINVEEPGN